MDNKKITLFIVSNSTGKTRKLVLSTSILKIVAFSASVLILAVAVGFIDYFGLLLQAIENKNLRIENAQLLRQFQVVETKVSSLENSLERVRSFTTKLKLITDIDTKDDVTKLNVDSRANRPVDEAMDYEPLDQRASNKDLEAQDQEYSELDVANEAAGEVAVETAVQDYVALVVRIEKAVKETQLREQSVIDLWESLSERQSLLNSTPSIRPSRGLLTSKFGYRIAPFSGKRAFHAGLDFAANIGTPVYAPADGVVSFAAYDLSYGKLVSLDHGYGTTTRYAHLSQIYVQVGQRVSKWDVIGAVGNTGRSTGPHLHYEVRKNGTPVNPINYILDE